MRSSLLAILAAVVLAGGATAQLESVAPTESAPKVEHRPIDFGAIDRTIGKLPRFTGPVQRYGLLLFGANGEKKVWAVLDRSEAKESGFDLLYLDLNANGDLSEAGERFEGKAKIGRHIHFEVGRFVDPGTKAIHTDLVLTWRPASERLQQWTRIKMKWRGDKITMAPFGPTTETYQGFATTPRAAPVMVLGYDRPFQFQHWMCEGLKRGESTEFKVFVGNRGNVTGAFSCVDDEFLERADSPEATLHYVDTDGKKQRVHVKLEERC